MSPKGEQDRSRRPGIPTATTSELNNLLQIISGTTELIDGVWDGAESAEKYKQMLRASIARATAITLQLVHEAGGCEKKMLLNPELSELPQTPLPVSPDKRRRSVLLVDDESMALALSGHVLTEAGYSVTTADSGFECLNLCQTRPNDFDLVVLDLTMPFMDGEETFARVRQLCPNLPVVLTTGFIARELLDKMLAAGLAGFIRKPLPPDEFVAHVGSILGKADLLHNRSVTMPAAV